jgi:glycosyltransferase involved in cell wall biosynthesis
VVYNPRSDTYLPPLGIPKVREIKIGIERKISPARDLVVLFELYKLFRRERFDVIVSVVPKSGLLGMLAGFAARMPIRVHIFLGEVWASRRGLMRMILKFADRTVASLATDVVTSSESERLFLEENGVIAKGRALLFGLGSISGVDLDRFRPDPDARAVLRRELNIPDDAVVCLYLGRLTKDKGVFELAQAFAVSGAKDKNLWLLLVGPDEDGISEELSSIPQGDAAKRMIVKGFTDTPEKFMATADFLCLPSYREGFGMVTVEAAAVGITTIGSRVHGITDAIVDNETGILFPVTNVEELSQAISRLANDKNLRAALSSAARKRVLQEFDQKVVVRRYVDFLRKLVDKRSI